MELIQGGRDMEVTASNVYDYVRKYAEYRMYKAQQKALDVSIKLSIDCKKIIKDSVVVLL